MIFTDARSRPPTHLIVVRRGHEATYEYLKSRLAGVHGVEITVDRRVASTTTIGDRRRARVHFNAFGILLVRR